MQIEMNSHYILLHDLPLEDDKIINIQQSEAISICLRKGYKLPSSISTTTIYYSWDQYACQVVSYGFPLLLNGRFPTPLGMHTHFQL